jgi:hypothetical protein
MPTATDQQLEQLKQKYQSVFNMIQQQQIRLTHVNMQDNKLFVQGDAPSEDAKNRVWDQIKLVNPNWQSELTADIRVASQQQASSGVRSSTAERTYTDPKYEPSVAVIAPSACSCFLEDGPAA